MSESFVQLPDDSGNTGKKVRTNARIVGGDTVHEHVFNIAEPLPAGTNNIGDVDVVSLPSVAISSLPSVVVSSTPGLTDAQLRAAPIPVSGFPATQPVSGTFFQATQPVSGPLTDTQLRAVAVPVSGFPATQPISAVALPLPTGAATDASLTNGQTKSQLVNGSGVIADVSAKGVQGAQALSTQDLNDAGRVLKVFSATFTPAVAEALLTLTPVVDGVAGTPATSFTITAGKRFRLQSLAAAIFNTTAAIRSLVVNLRMTATGAIAVSSPLVVTLGVPSTAAATASLTQGNQMNFPDGIEFSGTMQFGLSAQGIALAGCTVTLIGYEY
jgi:hypothetical protein